MTQPGPPLARPADVLRRALPLLLALLLPAAALAGEPDDALCAALREEGAGLAGDTLNNGGLIASISSALARLGDLDGATQTAAPLRDWGRTDADMAIAAALARRGDIAAATRTAASLCSPRDVASRERR